MESVKWEIIGVVDEVVQLVFFPPFVFKKWAVHLFFILCCCSNCCRAAEAGRTVVEIKQLTACRECWDWRRVARVLTEWVASLKGSRWISTEVTDLPLLSATPVRHACLFFFLNKNMKVLLQSLQNLICGPAEKWSHAETQTNKPLACLSITNCVRCTVWRRRLCY